MTQSPPRAAHSSALASARADQAFLQAWQDCVEQLHDLAERLERLAADEQFAGHRGLTCACYPSLADTVDILESSLHLLAEPAAGRAGPST